MKYQRPGYTETTVMFLEYLKKDKPRIEWINWLYTTSGFYDKEIVGSYFWQYDTKKILESKNYTKFIREYTQALKNSDKLCPMFHKTDYDDKKRIY
jgi:prolyl-tRNA synthetase